MLNRCSLVLQLLLYHSHRLVLIAVIPAFYRQNLVGEVISLPPKFERNPYVVGRVADQLALEEGNLVDTVHVHLLSQQPLLIQHYPPKALNLLRRHLPHIHLRLQLGGSVERGWELVSERCCGYLVVDRLLQQLVFLFDLFDLAVKLVIELDLLELETVHCAPGDLLAILSLAVVLDDILHYLLLHLTLTLIRDVLHHTLRLLLLLAFLVGLLLLLLTLGLLLLLCWLAHYRAINLYKQPIHIYQPRISSIRKQTIVSSLFNRQTRPLRCSLQFVFQQSSIADRILVIQQCPTDVSVSSEWTQDSKLCVGG